jgi:hypothetical protein
MQTYCESKTGRSINWYDRLNELKELQRLRLTTVRADREYREKQNLAHRDSLRWVTCACGNTCDILPREDGGLCGPGRPKDFILAELGGQFPVYIGGGRYDEGLECLDKIEARAAILIEEELKKRAHAELHAETNG